MLTFFLDANTDKMLIYIYIVHQCLCHLVHLNSKIRPNLGSTILKSYIFKRKIKQMKLISKLHGLLELASWIKQRLQISSEAATCKHKAFCRWKARSQHNHPYHAPQLNKTIKTKLLPKNKNKIKLNKTINK